VNDSGEKGWLFKNSGTTILQHSGNDSMQNYGDNISSIGGGGGEMYRKTGGTEDQRRDQYSIT